MNRSIIPNIGLALLLTLLMAACSGGDQEAAQDTTEALGA